MEETVYTFVLNSIRRIRKIVKVARPSHKLSQQTNDHRNENGKITTRCIIIVYSITIENLPQLKKNIVMKILFNQILHLLAYFSIFSI